MTTVTPKLVFCNKTHTQIPVWEIVPQKSEGRSHPIYYERMHREGMRPIGYVDTVTIDGTRHHVVESVIRPGSMVRDSHGQFRRKRRDVNILTEEEGYVAQDSWYEKDTKVKRTERYDEPSDEDC